MCIIRFRTIIIFIGSKHCQILILEEGDMKSICKFLSISILIAICASCSLSGANYRKKASTELNYVQNWIEGPIQDYEIAMSAYIDEEGNIASLDGSKGLQVLEWYLYAEVFKSLNGQHYDGLIRYLNNTITPITQQITQEGFFLLSEWNALTPPPELQTAHNQVRDCIEYEINKYKKIEQSYSSSSIIVPELPDNDPCSFYANAAAMILSH